MRVMERDVESIGVVLEYEGKSVGVMGEEERSEVGKDRSLMRYCRLHLMKRYND